MNTNIMIVGVGGQGNLLASRIIGNMAFAMDMDVKISEVHGMAQRGGSVSTYLCFGKKVYSPLVEKGCADYVVAFEMLEGYRWSPYVKKGGTMFMAHTMIKPMSVVSGQTKYPEDIAVKLSHKGINIHMVNALSHAKAAGNAKATNLVMLGALAKSMNIPINEWEKAITASVKPATLDVNLKAFELGYTY